MSDLATRLRSVIALVPGLAMRRIDRLAGLTEGHTQMLASGDRGARHDGRGGVSAHVALALSRTLGADLEWLVNGTGKGPTARQVRAAILRADVAMGSVEKKAS